MTEPLNRPGRDDADAKAWFYLDHRRDIEEWANLRGEGAALLERYLYGLEPAVQALADDLGADVEYGDTEAGENPRFGLYKPRWAHGDVVDVVVMIEWEAKKLLRGTYNQWPWVGVRLNGSPGAKERWDALAAALAPARKALKAEMHDPWPIWRYVEPAATAERVDVDALGQGLLAGLRQTWHVTAPAIDTALGSIDG